MSGSGSGTGHVDNGVEAMITQYLFIEIIIIYDMGPVRPSALCPVPLWVRRIFATWRASFWESRQLLPWLSCQPIVCPDQHPSTIERYLASILSIFSRVLANYAGVIWDECGTIAKCDEVNKHYEASQSRNIHALYIIYHIKEIYVYSLSYIFLHLPKTFKLISKRSINNKAFWIPNKHSWLKTLFANIKI